MTLIYIAACPSCEWRHQRAARPANEERLECACCGNAFAAQWQEEEEDEPLVLKPEDTEPSANGGLAQDELAMHYHQSPMATRLIYIVANNQQAGPYAIDQLRGMWNSGAITADTLYWHEGMAGWEAVHLLLSSSVQSAVQPPAMPASAVQPKIFQAKYDANSDSFTATMPLMIKLAMKAVQELGWKLDNANEAIGLVTFETGMSWGSWSGVSCSLSIEEISENSFRVSGAGKQNLRGGQIAAFDWGEAKGKAQKAINKMKELAR